MSEPNVVFIDPTQSEVCLAVKTGKTILVPLDIIPFIDIHTHIQSNNCAPLPLSWGTLNKKISADVAKGILGSLSEFPLIGKMNRETTNYLMLSRAGIALVKDFGPIGTMPTRVNADLLMEETIKIELNQKSYSLKQLADVVKPWFLKDAAQAGAAAAAITVDQTTANDLRAGRKSLTANFERNFQKYYIGLKAFHICIVMPMDLSFAHYWGRYGSTVYVPRRGPNNHIIGYHYYQESMTNDDMTQVVVFLSKERFGRVASITAGLVDIGMIPDMMHSDYLSKEYTHMLTIAPAETEDTFDDYDKQINETYEAAKKYPLKLIPFYHYDPRRHLGTFPMNEWSTRHAFFVQKEIDGTHVYESDSAKIARSFQGYQKTNADAFSKIASTNQSSKALFWGYKMYTELGYAPDDYATYPHLEKFYYHCQEKKIPITCHCSPGGMNIADSMIYYNEAMNDQKRLPASAQVFQLKRDKEVWDRRSELGNRNLIDHIKNGTFFSSAKAFANSFRYIDETCVNPINWKNVLTEFPQLRLNLAHFTGKQKIIDYCNNKSDYKDWLENIIDMLETYENFYTDISFFDFHLSDKPDDQDERDNMELFIGFIRNSSVKVRKKILFGSDWLMTEMEYAGTGTYYNNLCSVLRWASQDAKFDFWYQFAVLNNMRFLGITDKDDKIAEGEDDRLQKYLKNLALAFKEKTAIDEGAGNDNKERSTTSLDSISTLKKRAANIYAILTHHTNSTFDDSGFNPGDSIEDEKKWVFKPTDATHFEVRVDKADKTKKEFRYKL